MTSTTVLAVVLASMAVVGVWAMVTQARALLSFTAIVRQRPIRGEASEALTAALLGKQSDQTAIMRLQKLPPLIRGRVVAELAAGIKESELARLHHLADEAGVVAAARAELNDRRWWRRLRSTSLLAVLASPDPGRRGLLTDPHPAVRTLAVAWTTRIGLGDQEVSELFPLLNDRDGLVVAAAKDALVSAGTSAVPLLLDKLSGPVDHLAVHQALEVAAKIHDPRLGHAANLWIGDPDPKIRASAVSVAGSSSNNATVALLLDDPNPLVREAAVRSVGGNSLTALMGGVGRCLADPDWRVREAAIHVLRQLGPSGGLILQREARKATAR